VKERGRKKSCKGRQSPPPASCLMPSRSQAMATLLQSLLPSVSVAAHAPGVTWHGTSLCSAPVSCPDCVPSQLLAHPWPTCLRGRGGEEETALALGRYCSATAKTLLCYQCWCSHKTWHHEGCCEEN